MTREYVHGLGFLLAVWIIAIVCGVFIGRAKGQFAPGILWPLLFGPIGLIILLCLPNRKKEFLLHQQIALLKQQIEELERSHVEPVAVYRGKLRIGRGDQDLGDMPIEKVKTMLRSGELSGSDFFYDFDSGEWLPLDRCPHL